MGYGLKLGLNIVIGQCLGQQCRIVILTNQSRTNHGRAKGGDIQGHVRRTTWARLIVSDPHNRDWCLGRDPACITMPIPIQHHITDDQNARSRKQLGHKRPLYGFEAWYTSKLDVAFGQRMITSIFILLRIISSLPTSIGYWIGGSLGRILFHVIKDRRKVCENNIETCFPKLADSEKSAIVRQHFINLGIGIVESSWAWFRPQRFIKQRVTIAGVECVEEARQRGHGILLVGPHYTMADLVAMIVVEAIGPLVITYRPQNNRKLDCFINAKRSRFGQLVDVRNLRQIRKQLSKGSTVWFSPDQDLGARGSVFAPFFAQEACTITTTARLADGPAVSTIFVQVYRDKCGYHVKFLPFRSDYPTSDQLVNATLLNQLIERTVEMHPGQYMWIHRRFKTRPDSSHAVWHQDH